MQQQLGSGNPPGAEDYFRAFDGELLAAALHFHAYGPVSVKHHTVRQHVGLDGQIEPVSVGVQVGKRGAHPDAAGVVHGNGACSRGIGVVHVRVFGKSGGDSCLVESLVHRQEFFPGQPPDRDWPVCPVEVVSHVQVGLQFAEEGQQIDEAPLVIALRGPFVVVLRHAPQEHLAIHRS